MRCKSPLDSSLCPLDKHFLHSYDSYDSTTITRGLLPTRQAIKFPSLLNEMQMSTRQFTLSTGQALSLLVRLDYHYTGSLANKTSYKISKLSLLNEMQKSTRQFTLSTGQTLSPLVRLVRKKKKTASY